MPKSINEVFESDVVVQRCNSKQKKTTLLDSCFICDKEFRVNCVVAELLGCLHKFHKDCIDADLMEQKKNMKGFFCPECGFEL